jgi:hypothetical protein
MKLTKLKYKAERKHVDVKGVMQLDSAQLPFKYKVMVDEDFDHDAYLKDLEKIGRKWENKLDKFAEWACKRSDKIKKKGGDDIDIFIHDCTLMPSARDDWHLFCKVEVGDKIHRFSFHYKDPDDVMSLNELKDAIAAAVDETVAEDDKVKKHKEKLDVLAGEVQAPPTRLFD